MKLNIFLVSAIILTSKSHGICTFINPKNGSELRKGQDISMEVTCSQGEEFAWDNKKLGSTIMGYFTPNKDTVRFSAQNKLEVGDNTLYLFTVNSRVNPETMLIEDYRIFWDSVSVKVIGSASINGSVTKQWKNSRAKYSRDLLGRLQVFDFENKSEIGNILIMYFDQIE